MIKTKYILLTEALEQLKHYLVPDYLDQNKPIEQFRPPFMSKTQMQVNECYEYMYNESTCDTYGAKLKILIHDDESIELFDNLCMCNWGEQIGARAMMHIHEDKGNFKMHQWYIEEIEEIEANINTGHKYT